MCTHRGESSVIGVVMCFTAFFLILATNRDGRRIRKKGKQNRGRAGMAVIRSGWYFRKEFRLSLKGSGHSIPAVVGVDSLGG